MIGSLKLRPMNTIKRRKREGLKDTIKLKTKKCLTNFEPKGNREQRFLIVIKRA